MSSDKHRVSLQIICVPHASLEAAMPDEFATAIGRQPTRIDWANDQELFYWAMKWKVRSKDIKEAAMSVGASVKNIEACLRKKGWLR